MRFCAFTASSIPGGEEKDKAVMAFFIDAAVSVI
jgi:hypothetical protein